MTEIVDYGTLKTALGEYSHRPNETFWDGLVQAANAVINRRLRCRQMEKLTVITSTSKTFTMPEDFLELRSVYNDKEEIPACVTPNQSKIGLTNNSEFTYYIYSDSGVFTPPPASSTDLNIIYYAKLSMFQADSDTNAVLLAYPTLYLRGAMAEYCRYAEDQLDQCAFWEGLFQREIQEINAETLKTHYSGAPLSMRPF